MSDWPTVSLIANLSIWPQSLLTFFFKKKEKKKEVVSTLWPAEAFWLNLHHMCCLSLLTGLLVSCAYLRRAVTQWIFLFNSRHYSSSGVYVFFFWGNSSQMFESKSWQWKANKSSSSSSSKPAHLLWMASQWRSRGGLRELSLPCPPSSPTLRRRKIYVDAIDQWVAYLAGRESRDF